MTDHHRQTVCADPLCPEPSVHVQGHRECRWKPAPPSKGVEREEVVQRINAAVLCAFEEWFNSPKRLSGDQLDLSPVIRDCIATQPSPGASGELQTLLTGLAQLLDEVKMGGWHPSWWNEYHDGLRLGITAQLAALASQPPAMAVSEVERVSRIVGLLRALAGDCRNTDGWEDAARTVDEAADLLAALTTPSPREEG